jgi:large subunit ribosomal protein L9
MKIILLTDIPKIGNKYDIKDFKEGYAQNVFLSKGLAVLATPAELAKIEDVKRKREQKKKEEMQSFMDLIATVGDKSVTVKAKANEKGHLFKAVGPHDVVKAIKEMAGVEIEENSLVMEHIKTLGSHKIVIKKGDKKGECEIIVESSK